MAMNKKEQAAFNKLVEDLRIKAALRWTDWIEPDLPPPTNGGLTKGYLPESYGDKPSAREACSSAVNHGWGHEKTSSQRPTMLYSTRLLALKAARHQVEMESAARLAWLDKQIEELTAPKEQA